MPAGFLHFVKMSSFRKIQRFMNSENPVNVIYSQWLGYLDGNHEDYFGSDKISRYRRELEVNFVYAHTSGHAPVQTCSDWPRRCIRVCLFQSTPNTAKISHISL